MSVTLLMVTDVSTPAPDCQPTTIRLPFPVAGMVQVDVGNVCGPQEVTLSRLMAGTACVRVTLQLVEPPGLNAVGLQATPDTRTGASRLIAAVCEPLPRVAVTVAV